MPRNLNDLAKMLERKAKELAPANSQRAVETAMVVLKVLTERTPVDTSTALSNWQVSLEAPNYSFINAYVPGYLGYTAGQSAAEVLRIGQMILAKKKPGQTIYITNNAPYIRDLNSGSSKQAPAGFVEASVMVGRRQMPKLKLGK